MKLLRTKDVTDQTVLVFLQDSSATDGSGLTGVAHTDLTARYVRVEDDNDVVVSTITMAALSALTDAHSDGGWIVVDATNMPGWYRFDIPDGAFATGASEVGISLIDAGANDIAQLTIEVQLIGVDLQDAVRGGMTALPNAAADGVGGLPISDAGGLDLDTLDSNVSAILADTGTDGVVIADGGITAAKIATDAITADKIAADAIGASELAADAVAEIADAVWDEDATGHQTGGTFGQAIGDPGANTETIYDAVVTDAAGTNVAADIVAVKSTADAIETDTQDIQSRLPSALVNGAIDANVSQINGGATNGANATLSLKRLVIANDDANSTVQISNSSTGRGLTLTSGTNAHGALIQGNGSGSGVTISTGTGVGLDVQGAIGFRAVGSSVDISGDITGNITGNVSGSIGSLGTTAKADVNAEVDTALADYDGPTNAEMVAATGAIETDTQDIQSRLPAALVSGKIDANMSAINGSATNGNNATLSLKQLNISNSAGHAILAESTGGNGRGIYAIGAGVGAGIQAEATDNASGLYCVGGASAGSGIVAESQFAGASNHGMRLLTAGSPSVGLSAPDGITADVTGNLSGSIGSLATQAKADVNAEVVDTLATDTYAEPGQGAPGATISLAAKIGFLYKAFRNRMTQTSSQISIYNDDATTVDHKASHSDDAVTYDRNEFTAGP